MCFGIEQVLGSTSLESKLVNIDTQTLARQYVQERDNSKVGKNKVAKCLAIW